MAMKGHWLAETDHECPPRDNQYAHVRLEQDSLETCTLINLLGYGSHIRQARRDAYREYDRIISAVGMVTVITTGSKAEGLTSCYESDTDVMIVQTDVMCVEKYVNTDYLPSETNVFTLNTDMCYHGHCILFLEERPGAIIHPIVRDSLCVNEHGRALLSSDLYANNFNAVKNIQDEERRERAGPSMPRSYCGVLHTDFVVSLRCYCPSILRRWAERPRFWPPPDLVVKVLSMRAFVTPVGFKGSKFKQVEWRICFNTGENELVSSLNNTQVYIYVILKMVVKEVLQPKKKEITSYTVKNITLWLAENNPQVLFHERTLFRWLCEGLDKLRSAILEEHLSYYMIPERNLMAACGLDETQKRTWITMITDMIDEGPKLLLRIPKIRQAVIAHPEPLLWFSKKRRELELLELMNDIRRIMCRDENGVVNESDIMVHTIQKRMHEIVIEVQQRMLREGSRVDVDDIYKFMLM